jgi:hypothetical protein
MILMVICVMEWLGIYNWDVLDDGDDCIIVVSESDATTFRDGAVEMFLRCGHEAKIEGEAREFEQVEFCQSAPILVGRFWKFVRNPRKVLACALGRVRLSTCPHYNAKLIYTIGCCELVLSLGVPVLQEFALFIMRSAGTDEMVDLDPNSSIMARVRRELRDYHTRHLRKFKPVKHITAATRASFEKAFGIPVAQQMFLEDWFRTRTFVLGESVSNPPTEVWNPPPEWGLSILK